MERRGFVGKYTCDCNIAEASDIALAKELSDNRERYIAQSILTSVLDSHYVPTIEEAREVIAWASRGCAQ